MRTRASLAPPPPPTSTPGDTVTIETGLEFRKRRYRTGTVARIDPVHIMVKTRGPRGGSTFVECFGRRDGVRVRGLGRAELISAESVNVETPEQRRKTQRIDTLYREWTRNRTDVDRLRRLQSAISECLQDVQALTRVFDALR